MKFQIKHIISYKVIDRYVHEMSIKLLTFTKTYEMIAIMILCIHHLKN